MRGRRFLIVVAMCCCVVASSACTQGGSGVVVNVESAQSASQAMASLRAKPTYEQAETDYIAFLRKLRVALSAVAPHLAWDPKGFTSDGTALCKGPAGKIDGAQVGGYGDFAEGTPTDAVWTALPETLAPLMKTHGFTDSAVVVDRPGVHDVVFASADGATITIGSEANTTVSIMGACLLHAAQHASAAASSS